MPLSTIFQLYRGGTLLFQYWSHFICVLPCKFAWRIQNTIFWHCLRWYLLKARTFCHTFCCHHQFRQAFKFILLLRIFESGITFHQTFIYNVVLQKMDRSYFWVKLLYLHRKRKCTFISLFIFYKVRALMLFIFFIWITSWNPAYKKD